MPSETAIQIIEAAIRSRALILGVDDGNNYFRATFDGDDDEFAAICELVELRELDCASSGVTDRGFVCISNLKNLESLRMHNVAVSGSAFTAVESLQRLRAISCSPKVDPHLAMTALAKCQRLLEISISNSPITNLSVLELTEYVASIEELSLVGCPQLTDGCFENLSNCANLRDLSVDSPSLGDLSCAHIATCHGMVSLSLADTAVTRAGLTCISQLTRLERLNLAGSRHLTGSDLELLAGLPRLKRLTLFETVVDDGIVDHILSFSNLESLDLRSTRVSRRAVESLVRPGLRVQSDF